MPIQPPPSLQALQKSLSEQYNNLQLTTTKHAKALSAQTQQRVQNLLNHPFLKSRLTEDYIRGGAEILTATLTVSAIAYVTHKGLYRYQTAADLPPRLIRRNGILHGTVLSVPDGDGCRILHTPFLRRVFSSPTAPKARGIASSTISVRLAAVDAPEKAMMGFGGQPYAKAARDWLKEFINGKQVVLKVHSIDQYKRVVATVYRKSNNPILRLSGLGKNNVGLELAKAGYAVVYEGGGAQYGGLEKVYRKAVEQAKKRKVGMWSGGGDVVSPMEFKKLRKKGKVPLDVATVDVRGGAAVDGLIRFAMWSYKVLRRLR